MKGVYRAKGYTQRPHIPGEKKTKNIRCVRLNINKKKKKKEERKTRQTAYMHTGWLYIEGNSIV